MKNCATRKSLIVLVGLSGLGLLQACATTRGAESLAPVHERIAKIEGQVVQMETRRIPAIEERLTKAENKVEQVASKTDQVEAKADQTIRDMSNLRLEKQLDLDLREGLFYRFDSAMLSDEAKKNIDLFLSDLKGSNGRRQMFVVAGHADGTGTDRYNYNLGRKRAESVAEYLILSKRIDPTQVLAVSLGESSPRADNKSAEGREKNRRVEIRVYSEIITASPGVTTAQR